MSAQQAFIRAWYSWQRVRLPVRNTRENRAWAPLYVVEHHLDHQRSSVYSLISGFMGGKRWDYAELVANELSDLHETEALLSEAAASENEKAVYAEYIAATRTLLHCLLARVAGPPPA